MKRALIGALVGAVLIFGWQATSHLFMHYQDEAYKQVTSQDNAIQALSGIFKEEGQYLIPQANPNASQEDMAKFDEGMKGKPWALVTYHAAYGNDMAMASLRSYTTAFLCVLLFIWILGKTHGSFFTIFMKSIGLAVFVFSFVYYNSNIWLQTPWSVIRPEMIDLLVAWGLCGIWLGWWLNRPLVR